jgi:hypothetical protein
LGSYLIAAAGGFPYPFLFSLAVSLGMYLAGALVERTATVYGGSRLRR